MNKQKGAVSAALIAVLGFFGFIVLIAVVAIVGYVGANNYGVRAENQIKAEWENNENILAQYSQKVQEAAQVPSMMRDDMVKVVTAAVQGRYGANGSQATFQWLKEQNPNLDPALYRKIQQIIEAGRDEFKNAQTKLIDVKRNYENSLGYVWQGFWLHAAGFPKIDLAKYKAISNDYAGDAFKTGKEKGPIVLRNEPAVEKK